MARSTAVRQSRHCRRPWCSCLDLLAAVAGSDMTGNLRDDIVPEAIAKRRLLIYTLVRLTGLAVLGGGVLLAGDRVGLLSIAMIVTGAASVFIRPRLLASVFGSRW